MLKSMTGYGKAQCLLGPDKYLVEIRSVNGKNADITFKTQIIPRQHEVEVRKYITDHMARHKVPRYIAFTDSFPMNAAGKILKYKMREDLEAKLKEGKL